ncbi:hypothetical protein ACOMHN_026505 [Nucella lapillus]
MAKQIDDERLCFIVEWYEEMAARVRQFQLFYFVESVTVEMYDIKNQRIFLRKDVKTENLKPADLYVGNRINICGRMLTIVDFGDEYTHKKLGPHKERTLAVIKPGSVDKLGQIMDMLWKKGFHIPRLRMCTVDRQRALELYKEHLGKPYLKALLDCIVSGPVVAFEILGVNAMKVWREAIGPADPAVARKEAPSNIINNAVHGSDSEAVAMKEIEIFFPSRGPMPPNTAQVGNCTCCIIKPSAFKAGMAGRVVTIINEAGFTIGAAEIFTLEKANAEEFLQVYKGVVHEYSAMVTEMTSGPCLAMEIAAPDHAPPVGPVFRELVGPADPEIAKHLRPKTIRAIFGTDKIKNAVHCTDLLEDGQLEVEYFFRILDR